MNQSGEGAVSLRGISKSFDTDTTVIKGMCLELAQGEILVLSGPSGCGKTTTLRLIAGFIEPDEGTIRIEGLEVAGSSWVPPERRPVGIVFQDYALFPHLTIEQNVSFGLGKIEKAKRDAKVADKLRLVGLVGFNQRYPHELSGGEQQRVALARALAPEPKVVLLDEPFSNLDAFLRARVREEIRQILKRAGTTAIFVTHDQQEALALADRLVVLNKGRFEQVGSPEDVYHRPATRFVANFMGQANFLPGEVGPQGITTELGVWPTPAGLTGGTDIDVMLRPHDIAISTDSAADSVISARQFLGEENLYTIELASGRMIRSTMPSHAVFNPGETVKLTINRQQGVIFSGNKAVIADHLKSALSG